MTRPRKARPYVEPEDYDHVEVERMRAELARRLNRLREHIRSKCYEVGMIENVGTLPDQADSPPPPQPYRC